MAKLMTNAQFVQKAFEIVDGYKTLYVMGGFGACLHNRNKKRYTTNNDYNKKPERTQKINNASNDTFAFDCVGLLKGILWGWGGKTGVLWNYGGASYKSNGVPDYGANQMIAACDDVSNDFSKIEIGEAVWLDGHIGIYAGGGVVIESTPSWKDGVQRTALANLGKVSGLPSRRWAKHGKLPWIDYSYNPEQNPEEKDEDEMSKDLLRAMIADGYKLPVLKNNGKNYTDKNCVKIWQEILGFAGSAVDGKFGANTENKTIEFQRKKNIKADGVVGNDTWTAGLEL